MIKVLKAVLPTDFSSIMVELLRRLKLLFYKAKKFLLKRHKSVFLIVIVINIL